MLQEMARFWNYDDYFDDGLRDIARRGYYGLVSFLDDNIRQVLTALEDSGTAGETLVLYLSDHGEMLGDRYHRFSKYCLYDGSVRVPMILAGKGPVALKNAIAD